LALAEGARRATGAKANTGRRRSRGQAVLEGRFWHMVRKRLRRAVLTYIGAGCDCERSCP
jgi:hypothetical protein